MVAVDDDLGVADEPCRARTEGDGLNAVRGREVVVAARELDLDLSLLSRQKELLHQNVRPERWRTGAVDRGRRVADGGARTEYELDRLSQVALVGGARRRRTPPTRLTRDSAEKDSGAERKQKQRGR